MSGDTVTSTVRIVIADDHALVLAGLRKLLESEPDFLVVGEAKSAAEAIARTTALRPDVLLLDVAMPGASGLTVLTEVGRLPGLRTIVLTAGIEEDERARAFRLGARGILLKDAATDLLFSGIRAVMRGEYWLWRSAVPREQTGAVHSPARPGALRQSLTPRERDVLKAIVGGCTNREAAIRLGIGEDTVKHHVTNLFDKTGASTRVELALFAIHHQLIN